MLFNSINESNTFESRGVGDAAGEVGDAAREVGKRSGGGSAVMQSANWLQCDRCAKWRCCASACLPALRGDGLFSNTA